MLVLQGQTPYKQLKSNIEIPQNYQKLSLNETQLAYIRYVCHEHRFKIKQ